MINIIIPTKCIVVHLLFLNAMKLMNKVNAFLVVEVMLIDKAPKRFVIAPAQDDPHRPVKVNNVRTIILRPIVQNITLSSSDPSARL